MKRLAPLLLLAAVAACGDDPPPGPGLVHVVDHLGQATVVPGDVPAFRRLRLEAGDATPWRPVVRLRAEPTADEVAAFEAESSLDADGAMVLGPGGGGFVAVLPATGGEVLRISGRVRVDGEPGVNADGAPAEARLVVAHLDASPDAGVLPLDEAFVLEQDLGEAVWSQHGEVTVARTLRVHADARAVAVLCLFQAPKDVPPATAHFADVQLALPGFPDLAAELLRRGTPAGRDLELPAGEVPVARTTRPGFLLRLGDALVVPTPGVEGPGHLEVFAGLPANLVTPYGREVRLSVEVRAPGGEAARDEVVVAAAPPAAERWHRLAVPLAAGAPADELEVRFAAEVADGGAPFPCTPAFGGARLVADARPRPGPNVLLISIDTLRGDRCGWLGAARDTTPHLDELAAGSVRFTRAWATSPYTLPSHASLFTGQLPSVHGVHGPERLLDGARGARLAERLRDRGYATAAFTGGGFLDPQFGMAGGFDAYSTVDPIWNLGSRVLRERIFHTTDLDEDLVRERDLSHAADWIEARGDEPWFVFVHTFSVHEFDPPPAHLAALGIEAAELSDDDESLLHLGGKFGEIPDAPPSPEVVARISDLYDGAIHQTDAAFGAFFDELRAAGQWEDTVVILVSDHGKELGERGGVGHGVHLTEEMVHVPLLVRAPGVSPRDDAAPASLVDVAPTVLGLLGLPTPPEMQGADLLALPPDRVLFAEVDTNIAERAAQLRGDLKVIWYPQGVDTYIPNEVEEASYDLAADPGERSPLAPDPARVDELRERRAALRALGEALDTGDGSTSSIDADLMKDLEALGYGGLIGG